MKTLVLVRHAKSSWKEPALPDRLRPLNKRGKRDAPEMGQRLAARGIMPDLMISSPAKRAAKTAKTIADMIDYPRENILYDERLYLATLPEWRQIIHDLDEGLGCVMLFGHNPGLTELAVDLSAAFIENVPTCGVVELRYDVDSWTEIGRIGPSQFDFDYPKKGREQTPDQRL